MRQEKTYFLTHILDRVFLANTIRSWQKLNFKYGDIGASDAATNGFHVKKMNRAFVQNAKVHIGIDRGASPLQMM
jgi:hypothetical protein